MTARKSWVPPPPYVSFGGEWRVEKEMSVDLERALELADLLEPPFNLKDISLHDMRQVSEQLRALADEVEKLREEADKQGYRANYAEGELANCRGLWKQEIEEVWKPLLREACSPQWIYARSEWYAMKTAIHRAKKALKARRESTKGEEELDADV